MKSFGLLLFSQHLELLLTKVVLVVLVSSSGIGRNTARATQLAKIVSRMMISKGLMGTVQENTGQTW